MHRVVKSVCDFLGGRIDEPGIVAVSGGADSVALLRASIEAGCTNLTVAHVNHQLRGEESEADEDFVKRLAESLGLAFHSERIDLKKEPGNLEAEARRLRYEFLERVAVHGGASWIATGHTADDQAETVLHRLLRGAGLQGLRGIAGVKTPPTAMSGLVVIRPLLAVTGTQIIDYLSLVNQSFRTDSSNANPRFTRNRIRAEVVPLLKTFNPEVASVLGRLAEQAEEAHAFLEDRARVLLRQVEKPRAGATVILDRHQLSEQPRLMVREVLRLIWRREGWPMGEMDFDQWEHAVELKRRDFPGGISMQVRDRVVQLGLRPYSEK
jgi:tRNA(Ile)-lysidine synthase